MFQQKEETASEETSEEAAKNTTSEEESAPSSEEQAEPEKVEEVKPTVEKVQKKRSIPYPLNRIERVFHGVPSLSREQIQKAKDRLRWYERRDEERARTDKAKNDFESVIYSMRDWLGETEENMPFIGSTDRQEELLSQLSTSEEWLLDGEGEHASYSEYISKFNELDGIYQKLKFKKDEQTRRPEAVEIARKRLDEIEESTKLLEKQKPWINETFREDILKRIGEVREWLDQVEEKQKELSPSQDPAFKSGEVEAKITRVNSEYTRVSSTPKPKEKRPKRPKNFKIDNITIDGKNGGDVNWEDFIKVDNGGQDEDDYEDQRQQRQQQYQQQQQQRGGRHRHNQQKQQEEPEQPPQSEEQRDKTPESEEKPTSAESEDL